MKIDRSRKSGSKLERWVRSFRLKCQTLTRFVRYLYGNYACNGAQ